MTATHIASYYAATVNDDTRYPSLKGTVRADVCVVGGGFSGISTALSLAEHGFGPALVDEFTVAGRRSDSLVVLRVEPAVPVQLNALWPQVGAELSASRYLIECIRQVAQAIVETR